MLLDIGSVLGGIGLAVVAFVVVILVCVVILRLLAAILPSYEDPRRPVRVSPEPGLRLTRTPPSSPAPVPEGTEDRRE